MDHHGTAVSRATSTVDAARAYDGMRMGSLEGHSLRWQGVVGFAVSRCVQRTYRRDHTSLWIVRASL